MQATRNERVGRVLLGWALLEYRRFPGRVARVGRHLPEPSHWHVPSSLKKCVYLFFKRNSGCPKKYGATALTIPNALECPVAQLWQCFKNIVLE